jgi:hypothetical protein
MPIVQLVTEQRLAVLARPIGARLARMGRPQAGGAPGEP